MKSMKILVALFLLVTTISSNAQKPPYFKDGQTVCFVGNSITQDGRYHMLLQSYYATRFPGNKVRFISCGIGGDNASHMIGRFEKDVLIHQPDYAFLMTGMNDMWSHLFAPGIKIDSTLELKRDEALETYIKQTNKLADMIVSNGIKPIFMTPTIYDQTAKINQANQFGKNDALVKCAAHIRGLAQKHNAPVVDFTPFMLAINKREQAKDSAFTIVGADRVHPQETGHYAMAYKIISTLYQANEIYEVSINVKKKSVLKATQCKVSFSNNDENIQFKIKANALPFVVNQDYKEGKLMVPLDKEYNQELLRIKGIKKGGYTLQIDDQVVDTLSSKTLKKGINLALISETPQNIQALNIFDLCLQYHDIQAKLRAIANVDHKKLKEYKGADNMVDKKIYLDALVEKSKGKPWYQSGVNVCNTYYEFKPQEKELWSDLEDLRTKIYSENIPIQHTYQLNRVN
ncbi:SGNH/GDSL hydrolase family protein [Labilibacter marinus]|uniref:SGNH/GDSL hydrolase family protein n=1 Tax=Labilibacter marinus TaxID=1477105 RepID=UPI0009F8C306|nr:SGNH/GDSL hydrolase family protein [Labilibacter marinus]